VHLVEAGAADTIVELVVTKSFLEIGRLELLRAGENHIWLSARCLPKI
jgi:hypothetical protein